LRQKFARSRQKLTRSRQKHVHFVTGLSLLGVDMADSPTGMDYPPFR
jgi:hypothetical protein